MNIPEGAARILKTLNDHGYQAYLVGGCVRDDLLGKTPKDYDIATDASPETVESLFDKTIETGADFGTITVMMDSVPYEVTTFRQDGDYSDHRRPDEVKFVKSIEEDLARRDFTVNAMAYHPDTGLIDPFGGRSDLEAGIIRAVGDPDRRFEEDALRMMRAFRFAAQCGFTIEPETRAAIDRKQNLIRDVAVERIVPEMDRILETNVDVIEDMADLLEPWMPWIKRMKETPQYSPYHYAGVLRHTLDALKAMPKYDRTVAWALLLHDSGKPETRQHYGGKDHFKKHELASAKIAKQAFKTLKMPKKLSEDAVRLIEYHDTFYAPKLANLYKLRIGKGWDDDLIQRLFEVQYGDIMAHSTHDRLKQLEAFSRFYNAEKNLRPLSFKDLALNGDDIASLLHISGKAIGQAKRDMLEYAFYHPEDNTKEGLTRFLKEWAVPGRVKSRNKGIS